MNPGTRVGDYVVDGETDEVVVGTDSTGVAYLGTHVVLPRRVILKVMHGGTLYSKAVAVQMLREVCLLEAIAHPAVPRVFECGILPDRRPWAALERVSGTPVADLLASGRTLAIADLVVILRDSAELLAHAHARAVVHRRMTADTILFTPARASTAVCIRGWDDALTLDTESRVTVDVRDDVFALGSVGYRALTGEYAMPGRSAAQRCPSAPEELTALIDRMLAPAVADRPTAAEVRDRASWLADTVAPRHHWTPSHGVAETSARMPARTGPPPSDGPRISITTPLATLPATPLRPVTTPPPLPRQAITRPPPPAAPDRDSDSDTVLAEPGFAVRISRTPTR